MTSSALSSRITAWSRLPCNYPENIPSTRTRCFIISRDSVYLVTRQKSAPEELPECKNSTSGAVVIHITTQKYFFLGSYTAKTKESSWFPLGQTSASDLTAVTKALLVQPLRNGTNDHI